MAIFNRVLDFFNGDMGPVEPQRFQVPMSQPYVDDMFDPLFNREVVSYNRDLYGTLGAIPAGFAQMWDNALTGQEGILGPGMGILSTFGRSMDKADDFILGGLTEGVNAVGRLVGTNDTPTNPISNIFVEDQDYEGSDLLAAMGNAMGKLAGGAKLDRGDFQSLPDRLQSSVVNLATDPGFMGGHIARENPANVMADALSTYDDTMSKVAGNVTIPGGQAMVKNALRKLNRAFGTTNTKPMVNTTIYSSEDDNPVGVPPDPLPPAAENMMRDLIEKSGYNVAEDPEVADFLRQVTDRVRAYNGEFPGMRPDTKVNRMPDNSKSEVKNPKFDVTMDQVINELNRESVSALDPLLKNGTFINKYSNRSTSGNAYQDFLDDYKNEFGKDADWEDPDFLRYTRDTMYKEMLSKKEDQLGRSLEPGDSEYESTINYVNSNIDDLGVSDTWTYFGLPEYEAYRSRVPSNVHLSMDTAGVHKRVAPYVSYRLNEFVNKVNDYMDANMPKKDSNAKPTKPKGFAQNVNKMYDNLIDYLNGFKVDFEKDGKKRQALPYSLRPIKQEVEALESALKSGDADLYQVLRSQNNVASLILKDAENNPNTVFTDKYGQVFVNWARDVREMYDRVDPKTHVFAYTPDGAVSYNEEIRADDYKDFDASDTPYTGGRTQYSKPTGESLAFMYNAAYSIPKTKLSTVKEWAEIQSKLPDTMNVSLNPGASLRLTEDMFENPSGNAKALMFFAKKQPEMRVFKPEELTHYGGRFAPNVKYSNVETKRPVYKLTKAELKALAADDATFLRGFEILNLKKATKRGNAPVGQHYRLWDWGYGVPKKLIDQIEGDTVELVYLPEKRDYLSGIRYSADTNEYDVFDQRTLETFSTRAVQEYPNEIKVANALLDPSLKPMKGYFVRKTYKQLLEEHPDDEFLRPKSNIFKDADPDTIQKFIDKPQTLSQLDAETFERTFTEDFRKRFKIPADVSHEELGEKIDMYGTPDEKRLYALVDDELKSLNLLRSKSPDVGVAGSVDAKRTIKYAEDLKKAATGADNKYDGSAFRKAQAYRWASERQVIPGKDFLNYIRRTPHKTVIIGLENGNPRIAQIERSLTNNVNAINATSKYGPILSLKKAAKGKHVYYELALDSSNPNLKKAGKSLLGVFRKNPTLEDVVISEGSETGMPSRYSPYEDLFDAVQQVMDPVYKMMGGEDSQPNWMMHVLSDSEEGRGVFSDIHDIFKSDWNAREKSGKALDNVIGAEDVHLKMGAMDPRRSYLGDYSAYEGGFTDDPVAYAKQAFSSGVADSVYTNTVYEFFINQNFLVKNTFSSPDRLAEAFRAKLPDGSDSGNLTGLMLVSPMFNEKGQLIGIKRYNAMSDADIAKAFNDPHAAVLPNSAVTAIDRLLKKDTALRYKPGLIGRLASAIHHYVNVPFKFGLLSNVGFLAGNVQDAYFKQAETMAKAYGTTIDAELANVAMSYRLTMDINNSFSDVFDTYMQVMSDPNALKSLGFSDAELKSKFKNTMSLATQAKKLGTKVSPDEIMSNPRFYNEWMNYVNASANPWLAEGSKERQTVRLYNFIYTRMNAGTFENNNLDLGDLLDSERKNPYDIPENAIDWAEYGNPSSEKFTYGLMLNNPYSNFILNKSNAFESFTRTASVINSLMHQGWTVEQIAYVLGKNTEEYAGIQRQLKIDSLNAVNLMHHANFDYENVTEFMDKVGRIMPFPTFYLKNVAHWADTVAERPEMLDDVLSFHDGLWQNKETKDDEFAAEAKGRGAYPLGGRTKLSTGIVKQSPINSMFSAFSAVNNFKEDFAYRTHPLARPLTRHLQNPEDVKYRPYSMNPYERNVKKGDKNFSEMAYMFHQLNPYERYVNTYLRTPKKASTNDYQASDFLPSIFQPDFGKKRR